MTIQQGVSVVVPVEVVERLKRGMKPLAEAINRSEMRPDVRLPGKDAAEIICAVNALYGLSASPAGSGQVTSAAGPAEGGGETRPDIIQWQTDQSEWFQANIIEIVTEYAEWRDRQSPTGEAGEGQVPSDLKGSDTQPGADGAVVGWRIAAMGEPDLDLAVGLDAIKRQVARWIDYDRSARDREGLTTAPETHIHCPPVWPSHGQLGAWVALLDKALAALSAATTDQRGGDEAEGRSEP